MWFVWLVLGAIVGSVGGWGGAFIGAMVGTIGGRFAAQSARAAAERLAAIEKTLKDLRTRLDTLERGATQIDVAPAPVAASAPTRAPAKAEAFVPPEETAPVRDPEPLSIPAGVSPEDMAALEHAGVATAPASAMPQPDVSASEPNTPTMVVLQVIGAAIGGLIGLTFSIEGLAVGALFGWLLVLAVQAQNRRAARDEAQSGARDAEVLAAVGEESAVHAEPSSTTARERVSPSTAAQTPSAWLQHLLGGNIVAKIGVLILFFGVGFLLKYAYDQGALPVQVRLAGVGLVGFAMLYAGYRLLERRRLYGLILQGGGIGLLYLDVFFALKVYGLVDATIGFALFMALGVAATLLAVRQDAKILAVLGLTGAFLAPILASTQSGNHVLLFSYYTLLNAFILAISWFKAWRELNLVGFIFTFGVGVLWGANNYRPELLASVEPFVLIFFAMYLVIPILFAQRQPPELKGLVDGTLVFGTPLCVSVMQAGLVKDMPNGLAWSAGIAAALYALLAATTIRREAMRLLGETYIALALVFLTLAVFFAFDAYVTFALWTLEGAAILWVGLRQQRLLARWFGVLLQLGGAAYFLLEYDSYRLQNPWWNDFVLGGLIISIAGFISARLMHKHADALVVGAETNGRIALVWAALWWSIAAVHALYHQFAWLQFVIALLAFVALTAIAVELVGTPLGWADLRKLALAHVPALFAVAALMMLGEDGRVAFARPLANGGVWAWPLNSAIVFWIYGRHVRERLVSADNGFDRAAWILIAVLSTWDAVWLLDRNQYVYALLWGGAAILLACARFRLRESGKPDAAPIALWVLIWGMAFWFFSGLAWIGETLMSVVTPMAMLAFVAASCLAFEVLGSAIAWRALRRSATLLVAGMLLALLAQIARDTHPFAAHGWLTWPASIALLYLVLRRQEDDSVALFTTAQHVAALWFAVAIPTWELAWQMRALGFGAAWVTAAYGLVASVALGLVSRFSMRSSWPYGVHYGAIYRKLALGPVAAYVALWMLYANLSSPGSLDPLPYIPLLNVLDLTLLAPAFALWLWLRTCETPPEHGLSAAAAFAFLWANCVMLRTFHFWAGLPYEWEAMWSSVLVQSGFSLLWTAIALVVMVGATRANRRQLWMVGAALLGVVVAKLFLNDLSNTGTVARIVSFIGVGAGLLLIGYVAPVPPGEIERQGD